MLQEILVEIVLMVVGAAVTIGSIYLNRYLKKLEILADEKFEIDLLTNTIARLNGAVVNVVASIEETAAKDIRELVKAGELNKEELEKLAPIAVERIKDQVGEFGIALLEDTVVDLNQMIRDKIEAYLRQIKLESELGGMMAPKKSK